MKNLLKILIILLISNKIYCQNAYNKSIVREGIKLNKYYSEESLKEVNKKELIKLYVERMKIITYVLPYIAFARKPNIIYKDLGIPLDKSKQKLIEEQYDNTSDYNNKNVEYNLTMLPYADKSDLINGIIFYEMIFKQLHLYDDFN